MRGTSIYVIKPLGFGLEQVLSIPGLSYSIRRLKKGGLSNEIAKPEACLLYTSDAADDMQCVDLGGRRIIKKHRSQPAGGTADGEKESNFFKQKTAYEM